MNDINIKLWEMINNNQYVDIFKQKKFDFQESRIIPTFGTKRQNYERELTLKIIWSFYINNIILLRFNQGRPYYKLSSIMNGFKFDYDRDQYSNNILLPMSDIDYLSLKSAGNRANWNQLYEKSHIPTDATSLILSSKSFENSLSKLSNKDITFSNLISKDEFHVDLRNKLKTKYYEIIHDEKLVVINTNYWFSNIILRLSELIQYNYILCDIMVFKMCKYDWKTDLGCNSDDRGDSKDTNTTQGEKCRDADGNSIQHKEDYKDSVSNPGLLQHPLISDEIQSVEGLTTKLKSLNNNDWKILIEMIKSTNEYVDLIKLIPSSEYTDYSIVVGPTTFDDNYNNENETTKRFRNLINNSSEWWNKQELKSSVQQSWAKLPIYILSFTSGVLSIIYSLAVLTKYIKFKKTIEGCNISVPQQKQMSDVRLNRDIYAKPLHSHNDYWREYPLFSALSAGAISVESDICSVNETLIFKNDEIYVGHSQEFLKPINTLFNLYLNPLSQFLQFVNPTYEIIDGDSNSENSRLEQDFFAQSQSERNSVFYNNPGQPLYLWFDFKTEANSTYDALKPLLKPFIDNGYLAYYNTTDDKYYSGPLILTITDGPLDKFTIDNNNTNKDELKKWSKLSRVASGSLETILGSESYATSTKNDFNEEQKSQLKQVLDLAHEYGLKTRIWGDITWPWNVLDSHLKICLN
ncbi:hypothetical protein FOB64_000309 [Candida albicans]|uniref:Altered inheritance of mitochondria protein 6 n=1 Tax=Candida albicans TaxID=5476 RepID=A0A8H6C3Z2_CANAX|nr:hypothetical protein FOB64_000309 [Candida albicans]